MPHGSARQAHPRRQPSDLLGALRGARVEYAAWKDAYRDSGADGIQADILELERETTRIAEFQPSQLRDYSRRQTTRGSTCTFRAAR